MPGEINCLFTKGLIPFVEKERGPEGVAALCRAAGRPRDYLMADHNWLPLSVANELVRVAMELMGETDVDRWARRFADDMMEWKPSREYRHYLGTYTMGIGNPRELYERYGVIFERAWRFCRFEAVVKRRQATFRQTPAAGLRHAAVVLRLGERASSNATRPTGGCRAPPSSSDSAPHAARTRASSRCAGGTRPWAGGSGPRRCPAPAPPAP